MLKRRPRAKFDYLIDYLHSRCYSSRMNWQENLIDSPTQIRELILQTRRIAVLGIKTENQASQPAFYVAKYLASAGFDVIPVPVYYPEVSKILGRRVANFTPSD